MRVFFASTTIFVNEIFYARKALGHFISTFADSAITGLLHNNNGEIVITDPEALAHRLDELEEQRSIQSSIQQSQTIQSNPANPENPTEPATSSELAEQTSGQQSEATAESNEENSQPVSGA